MNYNISKELFEAVTVLDYSYCNDTGIVYLNGKGTKIQQPLLYNDFFFKCKEWAYKNGFIIDSCKISKEKGYSTIETDELKNIYVEPDGYISRSSEQQAVFDACTYILNELSNK